MLDSRRLTINNSNKNRIYLKNLKHKKKYYVIVRAGKKEEARKIMKKHITNQEMTVIRNIKEEY